MGDRLMAGSFWDCSHTFIVHLVIRQGASVAGCSSSHFHSYRFKALCSFQP